MNWPLNEQGEQMCEYCYEWYPFPVQLHHSEEECLRNTNGRQLLASENVIHVLPVNDLHPHSEDRDCLCLPNMESVKKDGYVCGYLVVHNSYDGRETWEEAVDV